MTRSLSISPFWGRRFKYAYFRRRRPIGTPIAGCGLSWRWNMDAGLYLGPVKEGPTRAIEAINQLTTVSTIPKMLSQ